MFQAVVSVIAIMLSALALVVSAVTAWLTLFRRGQLKMTRPTMIALVQDDTEAWSDRCQKVVIRAMLFSTSRRGQVIENLHAVLQHESTSAPLALWAYGETTALQRGGGLFVGPEGLAVYHHFCLLYDAQIHEYRSGPLMLTIFATVLGRKQLVRLADCTVELDDKLAAAVNSKNAGVMFNWNPESGEYVPEVKSRPGSGVLLGPTVGS